MSSEQRLRGRALQRARAHKRAESPLCVECQRQGYIRQWVQLDHIIPIAQGGTDEWDNLQGLCAECHDHKTRIDLGYKASGSCNEMGIPSDPAHHWNQ